MWSCSAQSCSDRFVKKLFGSSERMRAITQGEEEWDLPDDDIFNYSVRKIFMLVGNVVDHMN